MLVVKNTADRDSCKVIYRYATTIQQHNAMSSTTISNFNIFKFVLGYEALGNKTT